MDSGPDLLPNAFFSPSKAKQQRAQAQDWQHVDTWLASKFQGRSIPQFERNEDTLKALLALVAANEKADEERDLLWNVQKEALSELHARKVFSKDLSGSTFVQADMKAKQAEISNLPIVNQITSSLTGDGKSSLDALSSLTATLNCSSPDAKSLASSLLAEIQTSHSLVQSLMQLQHLQARLESELLSLRSQLNEVRSQAFQPPMSLPRQTMEWNRNTKQLRAKLEEYESRLASLDSGDGPSSRELIKEVVAQEQQVSGMMERVQTLESQLQAYKGLPKTKNGARKEVQKFEKELVELQKRRDMLFEGLVEKA
jgi:HAUS augmin-like complex subunit 1